MHYGSQAFAKPGTETIQPKPPGPIIGQRNGLSQLDIRAINIRCGGIEVIKNAFDNATMQLGDTSAPGTVVEWDFEQGNTRQQWTVKPSGVGASYLFINKSNNMALQYDGSRAEFTSAPPDISNSNQRWMLQPTGNSRFQVVSPSTGHCLIVRGNFGSPNGRPILVGNPTDSLEDDWYFSNV
jgi:hypothetical protein